MLWYLVQETKKVTKKKINKITQKLLAIDQCEDGTLLLILE
jgi:hypothetical protein